MTMRPVLIPPPTEHPSFERPAAKHLSIKPQPCN